MLDAAPSRAARQTTKPKVEFRKNPHMVCMEDINNNNIIGIEHGSRTSELQDAVDVVPDWLLVPSFIRAHFALTSVSLVLIDPRVRHLEIPHSLGPQLQDYVAFWPHAEQYKLRDGYNYIKSHFTMRFKSRTPHCGHSPPRPA